MRKYLISYDLLKPGKNYSDLYSGIRAVDPFATKVHLSLWLATSNASAAAIRDFLAKKIDLNDRLLVFHDPKDWAAFNMASATEQKLKNPMAA